MNKEFIWILKTPGGTFVEYDEPMNYDWTVCSKQKYYKANEENTIESYVEKAFKAHEHTFLKLRISELEDQVKLMDKELNEVTSCLMQEQLWREESLQEVIKLNKYLQELISSVNEFASRPTKDGANKLKDLVDNIKEGVKDEYNESSS